MKNLKKCPSCEDSVHPTTSDTCPDCSFLLADTPFVDEINPKESSPQQHNPILATGHSRFSRVEYIGIIASILIIVSLFLPWYSTTFSVKSRVVISGQVVKEEMPSTTTFHKFGIKIGEAIVVGCLAFVYLSLMIRMSPRPKIALILISVVMIVVMILHHLMKFTPGSIGLGKILALLCALATFVAALKLKRAN